MQKIKFPKNCSLHGNIFNIVNEKLSILSLPSQTPREKTEFLFILGLFQLKRCFMSVQNKMASVFNIILRGLTSVFSRMLENLVAGSLGEVT